MSFVSFSGSVAFGSNSLVATSWSVWNSCLTLDGRCCLNFRGVRPPLGHLMFGFSADRWAEERRLSSFEVFVAASAPRGSRVGVRGAGLSNVPAEGGQLRFAGLGRAAAGRQLSSLATYASMPRSSVVATAVACGSVGCLVECGLLHALPSRQ